MFMRPAGAVQVKRAIQLRNIVTSLGPAYIKVGYSSRNASDGVQQCDPWPAHFLFTHMDECPSIHPNVSVGHTAPATWHLSLLESQLVMCLQLGQALSIRPDILSPAAMNELQKLCDKVPSFSSSVAMQVIADELGAPWHEVGAFPPVPSRQYYRWFCQFEECIWCFWRGGASDRGAS